MKSKSSKKKNVFLIDIDDYDNGAPDAYIFHLEHGEIVTLCSEAMASSPLLIKPDIKAKAFFLYNVFKDGMDHFFACEKYKTPEEMEFVMSEMWNMFVLADMEARRCTCFKEAEH